MYPAAKMKIANKKGRMVSAMGGSIVLLVTAGDPRDTRTHVIPGEYAKKEEEEPYLLCT
jgi:hypothetical protein